MINCDLKCDFLGIRMNVRAKFSLDIKLNFRQNVVVSMNFNAEDKRKEKN